MCVLMGGGGLCVLENISTVWSRYFARKGRRTLWRVKTQMLDIIFFRESRFSLFSSACFFLHMSKQSLAKILLAQFFLGFYCVTFLSGDKPQIFGFIVMKSMPRRWLTLLCSGFFTPDERWGRKNLGLNWNRRNLYNYNGIHVATLIWIFQ